MSKEKRRVPKLRFPGFTEDWEQRKLIDIAKTFIGLVTTMTENYRDSGTLLIRNSDIKEGQFVFSENPIHLDEEFAEKNKTRKLQIGDVVTVHTGDIGTSAVIEEKEAGAIGFATINTRTDKSILNPYFLATYFNTEKHKCYANSVSTGDGRSNYNIKDFNKLVISIPTLDEQERISVLINDINTIITLHQRKLEHLNLKKKALLQKLFPKNGERYPELRFPGFTDAWEQRKLGDFYTFKNGLNKEKVYFGYGDSIVNFTDVFHNRQIYSSTLKGKVFVNKKELENFKVKEGDLFFTRTSETIDEIGFPAVVMEPMERVVFSGFVLRGRAEKNDPLVNIFKSYIFFTDNFRSEMKKKSSMTTRALTSGTALKEMYFSYPKDLEEQTKIGEILLRLDNVITLHQRKLEHLQLQKKALLQQMFV